MHARDALALARMDGTALKAFFALMSSGSGGLSSEQVAEAMNYSLRPVQTALGELVKLGMATIQRQGRLVRYVASAAAGLTAITPPENTGQDASATPAKVMPINVMLSGREQATATASHVRNSSDSRNSSDLSQSRQTASSPLKLSTGAESSADRRQIGSMKTPSDPRQNQRPTIKSAASPAPKSAPIVADTRQIPRPSPGSARNSAPIDRSAPNSAPIPGFSPAPPLPKDTKTSQQQHLSDSESPPREVVVVDGFADDLNRPTFKQWLVKAMSMRNPMKRAEFEARVRRHGLDYCVGQYEILLRSYHNVPAKLSGALWKTAIDKNYVGIGEQQRHDVIVLEKEIDADLQRRKVEMNKAIVQNDSEYKAAVDAERENLRGVLARMSEAELVDLIDEVSRLPGHQRRNPIARMKREGTSPLDVLTTGTVAVAVRDILDKKASGERRVVNEPAA